MSSYSAWRAPSSPYPRVVCLTLIVSFSLILSFGLMNRLACYDNGGSMPKFVPQFNIMDGNNPFVLGGFSIAITILISNCFISLFVWHWAFPLDENSEAECNASTNTSINESVNESIDDSSSIDESVSTIRPHFDFSSPSGYHELIVDIYRTFTKQLTCSKSKQSSDQPANDEYNDDSVDSSTEASSPDDYSIADSSNQLSEHLGYMADDFPDVLNKERLNSQSHVDFSFCQSNYCHHSQRVTSPIVFSNNHSYEVTTNHSVNHQFCSSEDGLSDDLSVKSSHRSNVCSNVRRILYVFFFPLIFIFTPASIYTLYFRSFVVDQLGNLIYHIPSNLVFGVPESWSDPLLSPYNAWIVDILSSIFGDEWITIVMLLSNVMMMLNEFLVLPLFYLQRWKHLSNSKSINLSSPRPRSIIWICLLPVIWLLFFGAMSLNVSMNSTSLFWQRLHIFMHFLMFGVKPFVIDRRSPFVLFGFITLSLIVDQLRHFRGSHHHSKCSCRLPYVLLLVFLLSESAGMGFAFRTASIMFHDVQENVISAAYMLVLFYTSMSWWQYLIRFVAFRALPSSSSALAVLFPVQLLEDVFSDLMFASFEPFFAQFFALAAFQIVKTFVRDSDLVSMFVLGLSHRVKHRHLPSESKPSFLAGYHSNSARALNRRVLRHQNFLIELCAKLVLIAVFLSDSLPFGDNPQWMATQYQQRLEAIEPGVYANVRARVWLIGGLLFLMLIQCGVHVTILRFITYLESCELVDSVDPNVDSVLISQSSSFIDDSAEDFEPTPPTSNTAQKLMDTHWTFHFLFFIACILRLVPSLLIITSRALEKDGDNDTGNQCYTPLFTDWETNTFSVR